VEKRRDVRRAIRNFARVQVRYERLKLEAMEKMVKEVFSP
jgi:hypothetical protein